MKYFLSLMLATTSVYALPFSVTPNGSLPSTVIPGSTDSSVASYTIKNISKVNPPSNNVKWLPPNVTINPTGTTCAPTNAFKLAPGQSCVLNLNVNGNVNKNDSNQKNHLMICMSDGITCAGPTPENSLNVVSYQSWISNLLRDGFNPVQGNIFILTNAECPEFVSVFDSCFGQNPAAPYIVPQPPIENSYVDPYYAQQFVTPGPQGPTDIFYRLGDNDALITIISYPPKLAYFGYQSYVFTSETSNYDGITPPRARTISPDPDRYELVGSVNNDVNSVIVQNQLSKAPWGNVVVYITTANQNLANALIANATASGINPNSIFIEVMGSNVITGNGQDADDLITLMRFAIPENSTASNNWLSGINNNVKIYKVTNTKVGVNRYGATAYTAHAINNSELSLATAQQQLVALLQNYLETAQAPLPVENQPSAVTTTVNAQGVPETGLVGSYCILYGVNCEADNQDTSTYTNLLLNTLDAEETAFIVGINHSVIANNNNYYVSVDIYDAVTSSGVASTSQTNPPAVGFDSGFLTGSASNVLQLLGISIPPGDTELLANIQNLYVTFIARNCNNTTIGAASNYCINLEGTSLIPPGHPISITERSYILPGTTTGGNVDYMLYPTVIAATHDF